MSGRARFYASLAVMAAAGALGGIAVDTLDPHVSFVLILGVMLGSFAAGMLLGAGRERAR